MKIILTIILSFIIFFGWAQEASEKEEWLPVFENKLPMRFFTLKTDYRYGYKINSSSEIPEIGNGEAEIEGNRLASIMLKFPIIYKSNLIMTGGIKYTDEQFYFEDFNPVNYPLYVSLNDRNLKNLGVDINGIFRIKENRSVVIRSNFSQAGDFYRNDKFFTPGKLLKLSVALGYGVKKNENTYYAFGAYLGYTFGKPSIYPGFIYSKRFKNDVGIDALLPQSIKAWKKYSEKFYVFGRSRIMGNSYNIRLNGSVLSQYESLQLRQSNIISSLGLYRSLGKWLWLEAEIGYSHNINFNISGSNFEKGGSLLKPDTNYLIKSEMSGAPFIGVSIFMNPPKDFIENFRN